MNRDDIIRMVEKAGLPTAWISEKGVFKWADLERFFRAAYEAGAAAEREACIECIGRVAAYTVDPIDRERLYEAMDAIRARGKK